jgi:hypothetical protein
MREDDASWDEESLDYGKAEDVRSSVPQCGEPDQKRGNWPV